MAIILDSGGPLNSVMVVGVNTRPIVKSAKSLGMKTISVDLFEDLDLRKCADELYCLKNRGSEEHAREETTRKLFVKALDLLDDYEVDIVLFSSGAEHHPDLVEKINEKTTILGNDATQLNVCSEKEKLFSIAEELGIPTPPTICVTNMEEALKSAEKIRYPVILKPFSGGGGIGIELANSPVEVQDKFEKVISLSEKRKVYVQKKINGTNVSTSILSDGERSRCLTINEQIIGDKRLGVPSSFGYCGNVVPLGINKKLLGKLAGFSETLCEGIGLRGSNGLDFVVSDQPYLVEVNPRFQGTMECVQEVLKINLVKEHIQSCRGIMKNYRDPRGYCIKLVLYSEDNLIVPNLENFQVVDLPPPGSLVRKGHPICSILKSGKNRGKIVKEAYAVAKTIYDYCHVRQQVSNPVVREHEDDKTPRLGLHGPAFTPNPSPHILAGLKAEHE